MRSVVLIVATVLVFVFCASAFAPQTEAQAPGPPELRLTVLGETDAGGRPVFDRTELLVPEVPIVLTVVFVNNDTTGQQHSFTINDPVNGTRPINSGIIDRNESATLTFTIHAMDRVEFNGTNFTPQREGQGIRFYCIPHEGAGMVGQILLTTAAEPAQEKGLLLRAYWIGMIGIVSMLAWIAISYFIIKSSSRHFTGHREHVRKGLP